MKKALLAIGLLLIRSEVISLGVLVVLGFCGLAKLFQTMAERGVY